MRVAIIGGTGLVGRYAVEAAMSAGHDVTVVARATGVDLMSGEGLAQAVAGADAAIDVSNILSTKRDVATSFFVRSTENLTRALIAGGVPHLVVLSIVGVDRVPNMGYYQAKVAQEHAARASGVPVSIVRATQFHEFAGQLLGSMKLGPLHALPLMRIQPVAARRVGQHLIDVANGAPRDGVELAGPEEINVVDAGRQTLAKRGKRGIVVPLRVPGERGRALRQGALLATDITVIDDVRFSEWLESSDFV